MQGFSPCFDEEPGRPALCCVGATLKDTCQTEADAQLASPRQRAHIALHNEWKRPFGKPGQSPIWKGQAVVPKSVVPQSEADRARPAGLGL